MPCRGSRSRPVLMSAMTSCQDGVRSTYPRSTDIRICLQRPFHPEAIVRTFGRHAVTGTAVVGSESTACCHRDCCRRFRVDDMVGCSRIQTASSKRSNWFLVYQQTTRASASLSLRVRRLDAWDLCTRKWGVVAKGPEVVWLRRRASADSASLGQWRSLLQLPAQDSVSPTSTTSHPVRAGQSTEARWGSNM